jgi:hypothetical protein
MDLYLRLNLEIWLLEARQEANYGGQKVGRYPLILHLSISYTGAAGMKNHLGQSKLGTLMAKF